MLLLLRIFSALEVRFFFNLIILDVEEDKNYESENLFESLVKSNQPVKKNEAAATGINNLIKTKPKEKEANISISKNLQSQGPSKNSQPPKKNIFDENAFDIFDKSGKRTNLIIYYFFIYF